MRLSRFLLGLTLVTATVAMTDDAFAKKKDDSAATATTPDLPVIEMTNIAEFDSVFSKAKTIQDSLTSAKTELSTARSNLNTALGAATDAPLKTALADLNTKAGGALSVAMEGARPKLTAKDAVPANVQTGIDAANGLFSAGEKTVTTAKAMVPQVQELVAACAAFPGQVPSLVKDPMAAAKSLKVVNNNLKAIKGTPGYIDALVAEVDGIWTDVKATFP